MPSSSRTHVGGYDAGRLLAAIEVATARTPALGYTESPPGARIPSAASDEVIDRVLKTRGVNGVLIALAAFSLSVTVILIIALVTR